MGAPLDEAVRPEGHSVLEAGAEIPMPSDPDLRALAEDIVDHAALAFERVAAARVGSELAVEAAEPDRFEKAAEVFLNGLRPDQREEVGHRTAAMLRNRAQPDDESVGSLPKIDLRSSQSLAIQLAARETADLATPQGSRTVQATLQRQSQRRAVRLLRAVERLVSEVEAEPPPPDTFHLGPIGPGLQPSVQPPPVLGGNGGGMQIPPNVLALGPIETKYLQLGGQQGPLGNEQGTETIMEDVRGNRFRVQFYGNGGITGAIFLGPGVEAFGIWGAIFAKYQDVSGIDADFLGIPVMDQRTAPDGIGEFCHFMFGGSIYSSPFFGAHEVHGAIRQKWESLAWELGVLGYPKTDESDTREPQPPLGRVSRTNAFHHGAIYWTPRWGAKALHDTFLDPWLDADGELGNLGFPVQDGTSTSPTLRVKFEGGELILRDGRVRLDSGASRVSVMVARITCNQSSKQEVGPDDIHYSGVLIDSGGDLQTTGRASIGQFRSHESHEFPVHTGQSVDFDLTASPAIPWPRFFTLLASFSEVDTKDVFDEYISKLVDAVAEKVEDLLKKAADKAGAAAGALNPILGFLTRSVLGALLPAVFKNLVKRIDKVFKDYVFAPVVVRLQLDHVWQYNAQDEEQLQRHFSMTGHGADYDVTFQWLVHP